MIEKSNTLLMSKELDGLVPYADDDELSKFQDSFILVSLKCSSRSVETQVFTGSLVGLSHEDNFLKLDMSASLLTAYEVFSAMSNGDLMCETFYIILNSSETVLRGPWSVKNVRILDMSNEKKMCTLGVDLVTRTNN